MAAYNTPEGRVLVKDILALYHIHPHDYQLDGILVCLDGRSLLATMATGSGKTGFFSFLMIVMIHISRNSTIALGGVTFPPNPAMVLVMPTKALQYDMEKNLTKLGLACVVINGDTMQAAKAEKHKRNLFIESRTKNSIILISPEELRNPECRLLLDSKEFRARVTHLGIDEVHLVFNWGTKFRDEFLQLGHVRSRFPRTRNNQYIPVIATTATIREGPAKEEICRILDLKPGEFHLLRRSNIRPDIQVIVRELTSSLGGNSFPDFDWVLSSNRNTVIFCRTISLGFRVTAYLWRKARTMGMSDVDKKIRMYNSLNAPSHNEETLGFLDKDSISDASVIVATDVLSVGWDSPATHDAVIICPEDLDELVQKMGRVGRDTGRVQKPRAFIYHTRTAFQAAPQVVANPTNTGLSLDLGIAKFLEALCKTINLNEQYGNPKSDPPCTCPRCAGKEAATDLNCLCSGCKPENVGVVGKEKGSVVQERARPGKGISKAMQELGYERLQALRFTIFQTEDHIANSMLPPSVFLPDDLIHKLVKKVYSIVEADSDLTSFLDNPLLLHYQPQLLKCLEDLVPLFEEIRAHEKSLRAEKKAKKAAKENPLEVVGEVADELEVADEDDDLEGHFMVVDSAVENEEEAELVVHDVFNRSGIKWKLNFKCVIGVLAWERNADLETEKTSLK